MYATSLVAWRTIRVLGTARGFAPRRSRPWRRGAAAGRARRHRGGGEGAWEGRGAGGGGGVGGGEGGGEVGQLARGGGGGIGGHGGHLSSEYRRSARR